MFSSTASKSKGLSAGGLEVFLVIEFVWSVVSGFVWWVWGFLVGFVVSHPETIVASVVSPMAVVVSRRFMEGCGREGGVFILNMLFCFH